MSRFQPLLFVNLPIRDVARSRAFFTALGFRFNEAICDESTLCVQISDSAFYMLLSHARFAGFTDRPVATPDAGVAAMHALSVPSREAVDDFLAAALAAGAVDTGDVLDHGFMYGRSFHDLDGHRWEPFWADPDAFPVDGSTPAAGT